jgi:hypothetical protein
MTIRLTSTTNTRNAQSPAVAYAPLEVHDQLVLEALLSFESLLLDGAALVWAIHTVPPS